MSKLRYLNNFIFISAIYSSVCRLWPSSTSDLPTKSSLLLGCPNWAFTDHWWTIKWPQLSRNYSWRNEKILYSNWYQREIFEYYTWFWDLERDTSVSYLDGFQDFSFIFRYRQLALEESTSKRFESWPMTKKGTFSTLCPGNLSKSSTEFSKRFRADSNIKLCVTKSHKP